MMPGKRRFDMLFPVDNEARQIKELNGIWKFKRDNYYKQGFEEKWFEKPLEDVIDMPVPYIPDYQSEIDSILTEETDKYLLGSQSLDDTIKNLMDRGNEVIEENK